MRLAYPGPRPPQPSARRRIGRSLLGSGALHLTLLALALAWMWHRPKPQEPAEAPAFQMLFDAGAPETTHPAAPPSPLPQAAERSLATPAPQAPPAPAPEAAAPPAAAPAAAPPTPPQSLPASPPASASSSPARPAEPPPPALAQSSPLPAPTRPTPSRPTSRPAPRREEARREETRREPRPLAFPAPMQFSLGGARPAPPPQRYARGAFDTSAGSFSSIPIGAPPRNDSKFDAVMRIRGAQLGSDWARALRDWVERHGYYPKEAARRGEDGPVVVSFTVDRSGKVTDLQLTGPSGSQWLDMETMSIFRDARVPPFPPSTREDTAQIDFTINYVLIRR